MADRTDRIESALRVLIAKKEEEMDKYNYVATDAEYLAYTDGVAPPVSICGGHPTNPYRILKEIDPVAYNVHKTDWEDSEREDSTEYVELGEHMTELVGLIGELDDLSVELDRIEESLRELE